MQFSIYLGPLIAKSQYKVRYYITVNTIKTVRAASMLFIFRFIFGAFSFLSHFLSLSVFHSMLAILSCVQVSSSNKQTVKNKNKKLLISIVIKSCMGSIVSIVSIVSISQ